MAATENRQQSIAVIDDDKKVTDLLRAYLEQDGFTVSIAHDGCDGLTLIRRMQPDLILLDISLPLIDGFELCRIVRNELDIPLIILSGRSGEQDIVNGFHAGADDYVTKPFSPRQLLMRIHAKLRRSGALASPKGRTLLCFDELELDAIAHEARLHGDVLDLTPKEFRLLETMAREPGRAFRRMELIDRVFGFDYEGMDRTIDVHVVNLRRKLNQDESSNVYIQTVYGIGYKFAPQPLSH